MQLGDVLKRMAELLSLDGFDDWSNCLLNLEKDLSKYDEDDVKRDISRLFGGMGSLNDIAPNDLSRNQEFRMLREKLYEMSHDRRIYVPR
jgi:hypothetical protein